jgi:xylitol oxidase
MPRWSCDDALVVERNWAGNVEYRSALIHAPGSLDALRLVVRQSPSLRVVGTRHSFNAIADGEVLVSLDNLPDDVVVDPERRTVTLNPAMTYGRLAGTLHANNLALHNLASLPHISVAGAIATATHGSGDRFGNLATAVSALELLRSDGEIVHLDRNSADFAGAVVNLGSLGVVVRVQLDVEPAYEVTQHVFESLAWDVLADNFDAITAAGDSVSLFTTYAETHVEQVWVKRRLPSRHSSLDVTHELFGARPAVVDLHPIAGVPAENCTPQLGVPGLWSERIPHFKMGFTPSSGDELQSELFVARADAVAAIEELRRLAGELAPLLLTSEVRTIAADSLWMSPHHERDTVAFHFTWRRDPPAVMRIVNRVERALSDFAPRPHWGKLFTLDARTLAERYPRHADFLDLLERLDPRHAFRSPWVDRVIAG